MAGRAGRRGKDTIGTVIILCKVGLPSLVIPIPGKGFGLREKLQPGKGHPL